MTEPSAGSVPTWADSEDSRGSSPWADTAACDLPDELLPDELLLDELLLADLALAPLLCGLTAEPAPGELVGQDAALEMYRAAYAPEPRAARSHGLARGAGWLIRGAERSARGAWWQVRGVRLTTVTLAVLAGGVIAAHLLFGLPGTRHSEAASHGLRRATHGSHPGRSNQVGSSIMTAPPNKGRQSPFEMGTRLLAWAVPDGRLVAGGRVVITADLTSHGRAVQGTELGLFEQAAGQRHWRLVTLARTGAHGTVMLPVRGLRTNARFLVKDAGRDVSKPLAIVVVPPVTLRLHVGKHGKQDVLSVRCRFAAAGEVVRLQVRQGSRAQPGHGQPGHGPGNAGSRRAGHPANGRPDGKWQTIGMGRVGANGTVSFEITRPDVGLVYRVVLLATAAHGQSVSNIVVITMRDLHG